MSEDFYKKWSEGYNQISEELIKLYKELAIDNISTPDLYLDLAYLFVKNEQAEGAITTARRNVRNFLKPLVNWIGDNATGKFELTEYGKHVTSNGLLLTELMNVFLPAAALDAANFRFVDKKRDHTEVDLTSWQNILLTNLLAEDIYCPVWQLMAEDFRTNQGKKFPKVCKDIATHTADEKIPDILVEVAKQIKFSNDE